MASFSQKGASEVHAEELLGLASIGSDPEACYCKSPGTKRNHNLLITNVLGILSLPGGIDLVPPGKQHFATILII